MKTETKLPRFEGKPLVLLPKEIPTTDFLNRDFGKAVLDEYNGRAKSDYNNASALKVLNYDSDNKVVTGSNPFAVVLVNQIISQEGLRTANQADLERILKANALPLYNQYEDSGLVLRDEKNPNEYLAKDLMNQIQARNPKAKMPAMIPLSELELVADSNSPHKLRFNLKENAEIFYDLSILNKDGRFSSENTNEKTGLPNELGKGERTLYTRANGLSRLYLGRSLGLNSRDEYLAASDGSGRVVVVSNIKADAKIQGYLTELQQIADKRKAKIDSNFKKAKDIMLSK